MTCAFSILFYSIRRLGASEISISLSLVSIEGGDVRIARIARREAIGRWMLGFMFFVQFADSERWVFAAYVYHGLMVLQYTADTVVFLFLFLFLLVVYWGGGGFPALFCG